MSSKISIGKYHDVIANINHVVEHYLNRYNPSWATIGGDQSVEHGVKVAQQTTSPTMAVTQHQTSGINLKSSHRGLFLGFIMLAGTLVAIILFFNDLSNDNHESAQMAYLITDLCLEASLITACVMALYSMDKLELRSQGLGVDDVLLLIAMAGSLLFEISILISTAFYLHYGSTSHDAGDGGSYEEYLVVLSLTSSVFAIVQVLLQTVLVVSGLRRFSGSAQMSQHMPGREALSFLVVTNVTMWIIGTAQVKNVELGVQEEFYGTLAWLFLLNLNLPLYLFFRFHSSVCLAEIWNTAYMTDDDLHLPPNSENVAVDILSEKSAINLLPGVNSSFINAGFSPDTEVNTDNSVSSQRGTSKSTTADGFSKL